jgi:hypothetical protein
VENGVNRYNALKVRLVGEKCTLIKNRIMDGEIQVIDDFVEKNLSHFSVFSLAKFSFWMI